MLELVTPPAELPVSLEMAKDHIRVDHPGDDDVILGYIQAATEHYDGRDGLLGRCLITQTWRLHLDRFPAGEIVLPLPPCRSIDSITYLDPTGAPQTFSAFHISGIGGVDGARLSPASRWPSGGSISITFTAGYGSQPEDVPATIRQAILTRVGQFYENREAITALPDGADEFVRDHREWSF